jgi:hypothetical protein
MADATTPGQKILEFLQTGSSKETLINVAGEAAKASKEDDTAQKTLAILKALGKVETTPDGKKKLNIPDVHGTLAILRGALLTMGQGQNEDLPANLHPPVLTNERFTLALFEKAAVLGNNMPLINRVAGIQRQGETSYYFAGSYETEAGKNAYVYEFGHDDTARGIKYTDDDHRVVITHNTTSGNIEVLKGESAEGYVFIGSGAADYAIVGLFGDTGILKSAGASAEKVSSRQVSAFELKKHYIRATGNPDLIRALETHKALDGKGTDIEDSARLKAAHDAAGGDCGGCSAAEEGACPGAALAGASSTHRVTEANKRLGTDTTGAPGIAIGYDTGNTGGGGTSSHAAWRSTAAAAMKGVNQVL